MDKRSSSMCSTSDIWVTFVSKSRTNLFWLENFVKCFSVHCCAVLMLKLKCILSQHWSKNEYMYYILIWINSEWEIFIWVVNQQLCWKEVTFYVLVFRVFTWYILSICLLSTLYTLHCWCFKWSMVEHFAFVFRKKKKLTTNGNWTGGANEDGNNNVSFL